MSAEPILIPCEGSGQRCHVFAAGLAICSMCGGAVPFGEGGLAVPHQRDDVLARLDRGDFDRG